MARRLHTKPLRNDQGVQFEPHPDAEVLPVKLSDAWFRKTGTRIPYPTERAEEDESTDDDAT